MILANTQYRAIWMGSKRILDPKHVFLELNGENTPDLDKMKAHLITEYGIDVDDPLDSTYQITNPVRQNISGNSKFHIFVQITPSAIRYGTRVLPDEEV